MALLGGAPATLVLVEATPAGAEVSVTAACEVNHPGYGELRMAWTGLPASTTLSLLSIVRDANGTTAVFNGTSHIYVTTDAAGRGTLQGSFPGPPIRLDVVLFRNTDGDSRWNPDVDVTHFRGVADVTTCPGPFTFSPK